LPGLRNAIPSHGSGLFERPGIRHAVPECLGDTPAPWAMHLVGLVARVQRPDMTNHIHTNNVIKQLITVYMLSLFLGGGAAGVAIIGFAAWPCRSLGGGGGTLGDWINSSGHGDLGDIGDLGDLGDLGSSSGHGEFVKGHGALGDLLRRGIARPSECDPKAFALDLVQGTIVAVGEGVASDIGEGVVGDLLLDEGDLGASERSAV
jgi:hypothetical protein